MDDSGATRTRMHGHACMPASQPHHTAPSPMQRCSDLPAAPLAPARTSQRRRAVGKGCMSGAVVVVGRCRSPSPRSAGKPLKQHHPRTSQRGLVASMLLAASGWLSSSTCRQGRRALGECERRRLSEAATPSRTAQAVPAGMRTFDRLKSATLACQSWSICGGGQERGKRQMEGSLRPRLQQCSGGGELQPRPSRPSFAERTRMLGLFRSRCMSGGERECRCTSPDAASTAMASRRRQESAAA